MSVRKSLFARFKSDQRGAVAILMGLTIVLLVGGMGLAVDYGRSFNVATRLRAAADAAALAGAKLLDENVSDAKVKEIANNYFQAQLDTMNISGVTSSPLTVNINRNASSVEVLANISVGTTFGQVMNVSEMTFDVGTTVVYKIKKVELAMVLDVTGSMNNGGRLFAMQSAARNIIDTLVNDNDGKHNRIALVPYSAAVNVGSTYKNQASGGDSLDGCVMERLEATNRDTDEVSGAPNNFAVMGQLNSSTTGRYLCPSAVMLPLSKDPDELKNRVDGYAASGWTAGHIGLAWGWNVISPKWKTVFSGDSEPGEYDDEQYVKAVILMTDGAFNTAYSGGESEADQKAESTARTLALCSNMAAKNIRIYTVAFEAPSEAETLLQSCASDPSNYFNADNSAELNAAFQNIAENLRTLRVKE